jgi:cyclic-di-AMP phosphodiesterase PgpH
MHLFRRQGSSTWGEQLRQIKWPHRNVVIFGLVLGLVVGGILAIPLTRASLITPGQPSPVTLQAPISITFTSEQRTRAAQAAAESAVPPVYRTEPGVKEQQRREMDAVLSEITEIRRNVSLGRDGQSAALMALVTPPISVTTAMTMLDFSEDEWQRVVNETDRLYDRLLLERNDMLTEADVTEIRERVLPYTPELARVTPEQREIIAYFVSSFLRANRLLDQAETDRRRMEARARVGPVQVSVVEGENVVRRGDIVTELEFEKLTRLGLVRGAGGLLATLQMMMLGLLTAWVFTTYLNYCQPDVRKNNRALLVIVMLFGIAMLSARLLLPNSESMPYAFPLATMSILLTVLFNGELALIATLLIMPLIGIQHEQPLQLAVPLAIGSAAGIFTAQRARRTSQFGFVGMAVAISTALAALVFWRGPTVGQDTLVTIILLCIINGALSGILAVGSYHFLGRIAHVVTPLELMELSHPNQPLLRRMMREAPGTYHHSMVVGNLAEVAAENIGADPLLARVGAYYHDLGKLLRPYFFTDNQHDRSNVHDVLDPKTSASIIIDHVREGMKMALENGLPRVVADFIPQHHGTNVVSYFYQRALQEDEDADIEAFRYPGPKPQTREAAIMMLADGVEATVRAKSQAGKLRSARPDQTGEERGGQTIGEIVDQIVNERIASGQLDESPLTLHDLSVIKESFTNTLQGIYHPRVDYPQTRVRPAEEPVAT